MVGGPILGVGVARSQSVSPVVFRLSLKSEALKVSMFFFESSFCTFQLIVMCGLYKTAIVYSVR